MKLNPRVADIVSIFDKGLEEHNAGNLSAAKKMYHEILSIQPDHCEANHNIGIVLVAENELEKALEFFKFALTASPNVSLFWANYIDTLAKLERIVEAKALIKAAKNSGMSCENIEAISHRLATENQEPLAKDTLEIDEFITQQKFDDAIEACLNLLETYPSSGILNITLGKCYFELGQIDLAISSCTKATEYWPQSEVSYAMLGQIYSSQGDTEHAIKNLSKAVELKPNDHELNLLLGGELTQSGDFDAAIESLEQALKLKPDYAEAHFHLGNALNEKGDQGAAIESYKRALQLKPDYTDAYQNMGIVFKAQGKLQEAIEACNKALSLKPDYAEAYYNMGNALKDQGKLQEAIEAYNKALAIKPDYAEVLHMLSASAGLTTNKAPRKYVENLFDKYAEKFDDSLVNKLEYRMPKLISDLTKNLHGEGSMGSVLDLGCGTGLLGLEIKKSCSNLEGIDLSNEMLVQARKRNVYEKLRHVDIVEYLSETKLDFDYFMSTDVFIYVGDLYDVFRLIKSQNKRSGRLVFSTEHTELDGFHLEKSGRYSHSKGYIESLCSKFDYSMFHFSTAPLRKDKGQFLEGGLYVLDF